MPEHRIAAAVVKLTFFSSYIIMKSVIADAVRKEFQEGMIVWEF